MFHTPGLDAPTDLERVVRTIRGTPQPTMNLPLRHLSELVDRLIIGPTQEPGVMMEAFIELPANAGAPEPEKKVFLSMIPLCR